jgi:enhancing lycopene biosynthesis protein 2
MKQKIGLLLSGCGVYDGAEIHESVLSLLAIAEQGAEAVCIGVDHPQHHVVNHANGKETSEVRNMLVEAARIARGQIRDLSTVSVKDIDALVIPGGFGSAKNLTTWAVEGVNGSVLPQVKKFIQELNQAGKPIAALCVSPVVIAKALQGSNAKVEMTLGSDEEDSPYDIGQFSSGLNAVGMTAVMKKKDEIHVDTANKIVSAPCYMMETDLVTLKKNISDAIEALIQMA